MGTNKRGRVSRQRRWKWELSKAFVGPGNRGQTAAASQPDAGIVVVRHATFLKARKINTAASTTGSNFTAPAILNASSRRDSMHHPEEVDHGCSC